MIKRALRDLFLSPIPDDEEVMVPVQEDSYHEYQHVPTYLIFPNDIMFYLAKNEGDMVSEHFGYTLGSVLSKHYAGYHYLYKAKVTSVYVEQSGYSDLDTRRVTKQLIIDENDVEQVFEDPDLQSLGVKLTNLILLSENTTSLTDLVFSKLEEMPTGDMLQVLNNMNVGDFLPHFDQAEYALVAKSHRTPREEIIAQLTLAIYTDPSKVDVMLTNLANYDKEKK